MDCRLLCPWNFLGKNTGVGCHALLKGIFLTQESNPSLLHCRQILYHLSHQEKQEDNETESMAIKGDPSEREFGYEKHPETFPHGEKEKRNLFFPSRKLVAVICGSYFTCDHSTCFIHLTDATVCFSLFQQLEFLYTIV